MSEIHPLFKRMKDYINPWCCLALLVAILVAGVGVSKANATEGVTIAVPVAEAVHRDTIKAQRTTEGTEPEVGWYSKYRAQANARWEHWKETRAAKKELYSKIKEMTLEEVEGVTLSAESIDIEPIEVVVMEVLTTPEKKLESPLVPTLARLDAPSSGPVLEEEQLALIQLKEEMVSKREQYDIQQMECLAINAYHEARGEGTVGILATMHVVKNRLDIGYKGAGSYCDVVEANAQFSWLWDNISDSVEDLDSYIVILYLAERFIKGDYPLDITGGATHYHGLQTTMPYWARDNVPGGLDFLIAIGNHRFYK